MVSIPKAHPPNTGLLPMIQVICPRCRKLLNVSEQDIGITGHCARCHGHVAILDALEPTPHSEAPPAMLASDQDHAEWQAILRNPKTPLRSLGIKSDVHATSLPHHCLTSILINLNQLVYLLRYKRNEIPDEKEFKPEREERARWQAEMGSFGFAVLDNNVERRVHNVQDALKPLRNPHFQELHQQLRPLLQDADSVPTNDLVAIIERIKQILLAVDQAGMEFQFQRSGTSSA